MDEDHLFIYGRIFRRKLIDMMKTQISIMMGHQKENRSAKVKGSARLTNRRSVSSERMIN